MTCILDRLDECIEETLSPFLAKIQGLLAPGSPTSNNKAHVWLKVIVTSSNKPKSLNDFLESFPRLRLDFEFNETIKKDIERYIDHQMQELACSERKKPQLHLIRANIKQKLVDSSESTYLWVIFAISSLKRETCAELEAALGMFPKGFDGMYRRMLSEIQETKREVVVSMLRWICTAFRRLTLEGLGTALKLPRAIEIEQSLDDAVFDYLESFAGCLVVVIRKDAKLEKSPRIVSPIHASWWIFYTKSTHSQWILPTFDLTSVFATPILRKRRSITPETSSRIDRRFWETLKLIH